MIPRLTGLPAQPLQELEEEEAIHLLRLLLLHPVTGAGEHVDTAETTHPATRTVQRVIVDHAMGQFWPRVPSAARISPSNVYRTLTLNMSSQLCSDQYTSFCGAGFNRFARELS